MWKQSSSKFCNFGWNSWAWRSGYLHSGQWQSCLRGMAQKCGSGYSALKRSSFTWKLAAELQAIVFLWWKLTSQPVGRQQHLRLRSLWFWHNRTSAKWCAKEGHYCSSARDINQDLHFHAWWTSSMVQATAIAGCLWNTSQPRTK